MKSVDLKPCAGTIILLICLAISSCTNPLGNRDYNEDLYIDIPDTQDRLLIKEWQYLLGSGAEVYFVSSVNGEAYFLGNIQGGDDGYCPFKDGKYEVSYTEGVVNLSWSFDGSEIYTKNQSFILPDSSLDSE